MGQIDLFQNDSYSIGPCAKRPEETTTQKNVNINIKINISIKLP